MANERSDKRARKRRRGGFVDVINALLTLLVLGILVGVGIFLYGANAFYTPGAVKADTNFTVDKGASMGTTAQRLEEQGLIPPGQVIPSQLIFRVGAYGLKKEKDLKQGVYLLKANSSMADVLRELTEGKSLDFFVNVIPGDTSFLVAERLNADNPNLTGEPVTVPAEGSLLAVRYDFFPGDTRQSVLDKMQAQMKARLAEIWEGRDRAIDSVIKSPEDLLTLASIVEKETGLETERPQVAAVFINRLKKGMRLQTDPTVLYGVTQGKAILNRGPTSSELKQKTPYNTYQVDGLPPGPIANPGEKSLAAVAHPAATNDLYFVAKSADPADGHLFAATYAQHRKNVALYRKAAAEADAEAAKEALEAEQAKGAGETVEQVQ
ncbi:MAG: endolytic transglycosylase MltG [Devosia sp.]|uniref:endolytic transglycosylase MltG n=1 Tax=Devosia sp. TaxID=1871048 RepID=UPI001ACD2FD3|nr:endolytic transglycosylase MltG [Devosia sp.]MBN9316251.1 endolytic transglycosylase MltG [Devosia sp.]